MASPLNEELLEDLYAWVDQIPLSRPKKDIRRDFSDGVLVAEVVKYYMPRMVEIHNYNPANNAKNKTNNWNQLKRKVFSKLNLEVRDEVVDNIVSCKPWAIEHFLMLLRRKIDRYLYETHRIEAQNAESAAMNEKPEVDQMYKDYSISVEQNQGKQRGTNQKRVVAKQQPQQPPAQHYVMTTAESSPTASKRAEMVPRVQVEEKEQEILAKVETIQILNAKVRRLEHLLHLKDIRIDDLQERLDQIDVQMRPTGHGSKPPKQKSPTKH